MLEDVVQSSASCVITAHAVHTAARRRGSRTQINARQWRTVRRRTKDWSRNQLRQICCAAVDVAACQIWIRFLEISSTHFVAGEDAIAKTGSESLDLRLNALRHVDLAVEWNMAVRPKRVLPARGASFVKKTLLRDQHKRTFGNFPARNVALSSGAFIDAASEMNCAGAAACFGFPWNRTIQGIVDFENPRCVPKRFQSAAIPGRQSIRAIASNSSWVLPSRTLASHSLKK